MLKFWFHFQIVVTIGKCVWSKSTPVHMQKHTHTQKSKRSVRMRVLQQNIKDNYADIHSRYIHTQFSTDQTWVCLWQTSFLHCNFNNIVFTFYD